jgi:hypothetical protein
MAPVDGGEDPPDTRAAVSSDVPRTPRPIQALLGIAVAASLWAAPVTTFAGEAKTPADHSDHTIVFGLTAGQLAIAAAVGAGAGATGALVSSNVIAGASLGFGTLAAIYVAHLAAEAVVVGGVYYWWPWASEPESPASRTMKIRDAGKGPLH